MGRGRRRKYKERVYRGGAMARMKIGEKDAE